MNIIDTHCHLDLQVFDTDRADIIAKCNQLGITGIIIPGIESGSWDKLLQLTSTDQNLYPALGLHPVFISSHTDNDIALLDQYVTTHRIYAIGEIGLDFFITDTDRNKQITFFDRQLSIAEKNHLPVILHVRKAHDEVLSMLKTRRLSGGTCHAFNGSIDQAKKYIELGFKLGFGGTMTYPNARKIHQLARNIPLESIVLETDAPDMSGYQHKGERNQPDYIMDALNALAVLKDMSVEEVAYQTTQNATALFRL